MKLKLLFLALIFVTGDARQSIVRKDNVVIAATVDGYLCYGTRRPLTVQCHRAIPMPEIK